MTSAPVLLTGAAGFIGSHVADRLLAAGGTVVGLDNFDPFYPRAYKERNLQGALTQPGFHFVEGDIRDAELVRRLMEQHRPVAIVHLAARAGVRASLADPVGTCDVNLAGTLTLLDAARAAGCTKFLFASSSSVYGDTAKVPFAEDDRVDRPVSPYAMTKKAGEEICYSYHHLHGIDVIALRFFTVYGPRGRPEMAVHKFAQLMTEGEPIPVYGDGEMERDFTFVDDIVTGCEGALDLLLRSSGCYAIYNLAAAERVTLARMIDCLERTLGVTAERRMLPMQPGDVRRTAADISRARSAFGYAPQTRIESGIAAFVAWYTREILPLPAASRARTTSS
ncbi:MAG: NAD-dependent epimerase/dehydratase family protein [Gemmatimonadota bacterium]